MRPVRPATAPPAPRPRPHPAILQPCLPAEGLPATRRTRLRHHRRTAPPQPVSTRRHNSRRLVGPNHLTTLTGPHRPPGRDMQDVVRMPIRPEAALADQLDRARRLTSPTGADRFTAASRVLISLRYLAAAPGANSPAGTQPVIPCSTTSDRASVVRPNFSE
jgi:hypothetical protein